MATLTDVLILIGLLKLCIHTMNDEEYQ